MTTRYDEAARLRAAIAVYSEPMSAELVALVIRNRGQDGLDRLVTHSAIYVEAKKAELAVVLGQ